MATNTIVDIVKISELDQLQVPTTKDELVINNYLVNQDDYESKRISITDLADYIGGTINLRDLVDVCNTSPRVGQYLQWNGTCWNPAFHIPLVKFSDFSATNYPTPYQGGRLGYDGRGGFTFEPADVYGPLSNHRNVSGATPVNRAVLTFDAPSGFWYPEGPYQPTILQQTPTSWPANKGELRIQGDRTFVYTPPYLEDFLTEYIETDPVFTASPAGSITQFQITNWDTAYNWGDHSIQGYLKSLSVGQLSDVTLSATKNTEVLIYDSVTNRWKNGPVYVPSLGEVGDTNIIGISDQHILKYNARTYKWENKPLKVNEATDVNTSELGTGSTLVWNGASYDTLRYPYVRQINVGPGMSGGGIAGSTNNGVLNIGNNYGKGIGVSSNAITADLTRGLSFFGNSIGADIGGGLTFSGNKIVASLGNGLNLNGGTINVSAGAGLFATASAINVGEGVGLKVTNDKVALVDNFRGSNGVPRKNSGLNINNNELTVAIDNKTVRINGNNQLYSTISSDVDLVNKIVAGRNVTISPTDGTGIVTINAADAGVKRLIAGNNITLSPSDGIGTVTVSTTSAYWNRNPSTSSLIPKDSDDNLLINSTITAKNFNIPYLPELKDVRDSDLFMVHRNGASYKMSYATFKSVVTDPDPELSYTFIFKAPGYPRGNLTQMSYNGAKWNVNNEKEYSVPRGTVLGHTLPSFNVYHWAIDLMNPARLKIIWAPNLRIQNNDELLGYNFETNTRFGPGFQNDYRNLVFAYSNDGVNYTVDNVDGNTYQVYGGHSSNAAAGKAVVSRSVGRYWCVYNHYTKGHAETAMRNFANSPTTKVEFFITTTNWIVDMEKP